MIHDSLCLGSIFHVTSARLSNRTDGRRCCMSVGSLECTTSARVTSFTLSARAPKSRISFTGQNTFENAQYRTLPYLTLPRNKKYRFRITVAKKNYRTVSRHPKPYTIHQTMPREFKYFTISLFSNAVPGEAPGYYIIYYIVSKIET